MNERELARHSMFGRASAFVQIHKGDFAPDSEALSRGANLTRITLALDQARAARQGGGATAKSVLLDAHRIDVRNVTRTAEAVDLSEPGFAGKFPPPKSSSEADLLAASDNTLARLLPSPGEDEAAKAEKAALAARFIAKELPADFVQQLAADRARIREAQDDQEDEREAGVKGTSAVGRLIREGMIEWKHLNAIMHNKYTRDPDKLRAWKSASHIERPAQREKKPQPPAPAPAPTPPPPGPAR